MKRSLRRNRRTFYYAEYIEKNPIQNEAGLYTGEHGVVSSKPIKVEANISAARGKSESKMFGENIDYSRTISIADKTSVNINEVSVLWIDCLPEIDENGNTSTPHDYTVAAIGDSINHLLIAVRKVDVSKKKED